MAVFGSGLSSLARINRLVHVLSAGMSCCSDGIRFAHLIEHTA